ncbi:MAG: DNA-protecting protein DprA [Jatrophihabitans endophyticus]|nr:DNA-protecting protein DprA [Jatrophihabitans endophyticus]
MLLARAFLSRAAEPACIPLWHLVRTHGPVEAVSLLRRGQVDDEMLVGLARRIEAVDPHADLEAADRHGVRLVVPESDEWPHFALAALERTGEARLAEFLGGKRAHADGGEPVPPLALWVRGPLDISALAVRSVGIVGARSATAYGHRVATDLGYGLALRDFVVVSGGAYGIDVAAHRGALAAAGTTVVVTAGGAERAYPSSHHGLFEQAAERGAIVSESPVGCAPRRGRFLTRNRLIAAFGTGTTVVEASARSGALNTARHAQKQGRTVMAVPGPVTSAMSVGCHDLLLQARGPCDLVTGVDDVVSAIGSSGDLATALADGSSVGNAPTVGRHRSASAVELRVRLDELEAAPRAIYDGMPAARSITPDELAASCAASVVDVIRALPALELAGLVERTRDGYRRCRAPAP